MLGLVWLGLRVAALDRPFWMDESTSAALAFQPPSTVVDVVRKDVHPPGYYLLLNGWNRLMRAALPSPDPPGPWRLVDFRVQAIETAGVYTWQGPPGLVETAGVFPREMIYWNEAPLAPLAALRVLSLVFGALAAGMAWLLARRLFPCCPLIQLLVLGCFSLSGYTLAWDTVIRSYNLGAACTAGMVLAGVWALQSGRLRTGAVMVALLSAAAFLTNYPALVMFPGAALAIWLAGGMNRRSFAFASAGFAAGGAICLILWGPAFFAQFGRVPSREALSAPFGQALGTQIGRVSLDYWRMLFAEGAWHWLADRQSGRLDPLLALSPVNPVLYTVAFAGYAAAIGAALYRLARHPSPTLAAIAIAAWLPGAIVILGNTLKPDFFRFHARHFYPAAPFFYLMLAYGVAALFGQAEAAERPASQPVENAACKL